MKWLSQSSCDKAALHHYSLLPAPCSLLHRIEKCYLIYYNQSGRANKISIRK
ncbi:MAG: hypothetical protein F6K56_33570 [Moorea sp. SIO3G5]|nr:hypothetical protein [Moorena sp. SIO3G5]